MKLVGKPKRWNHQQMKEAVGQKMLTAAIKENGEIKISVFHLIIMGVKLSDDNKWELVFDSVFPNQEPMFLDLKSLKRYYRSKFKGKEIIFE